MEQISVEHLASSTHYQPFYIFISIQFYKVQRCDGEDDCPYVSPSDEEQIVDENDRNKSWDERNCIDFTPPTNPPSKDNQQIIALIFCMINALNVLFCLYILKN